MVDLSKIFDGIEKIAYDILIWILLVPKTLAQILVNPSWVPGYVTKELGEDEGKRFDDYLSPVMLLLLASLLPYAFYLITPQPAVSLNSSVQVDENYAELAPGTEAAFWATYDFIADTGTITFDWTVTGGEITESSENTLFAVWDESGYYQVDVVAKNEEGEELSTTYYVYVLGEGETAAAPASTSSAAGGSGGNLLEALDGPAMLLPTLIFLSLPMLFAIATEAFRGYPLMRSTLKRSFYIQCYFFAPFILVMWSLFLGLVHFVTPNEWGVGIFLLAVTVYSVLWLIRIETKVISDERALKSKLTGFGIVFICIAVFLAAASGMVLLLDEPETFRQSLAWFYILGTIGLVVAGIRFRRKSKRAKTSAAPSESNVAA